MFAEAFLLYITGTTAQEVDFFPPDSEHIATWNQTTYEERVRQKLSTFSDFIAEMALRLYPMQNQTAEFQFTSMISDLRMNCGNDYASLVLAKSFRSRVFRYVMTFVPSTPFTVENSTFAPRYSAHAVDVIAFYGNGGNFITSLSANDLPFQNIMRQEVTSFFKTGSPYTASWGPYPNETALLSGTVDISSGYHTSECQFWFANGFLAYSWVN